MQLVPFGKINHIAPLLVKDSTGSLVNADSLPTVLNVQKNGADASEAAVSISQAQDDTPANITGKYLISCDLTGSGLDVAVNDQIIVTVQAIIASTVVTSTFSFTMADLAGNVPSVEIG